ncbi:hypothetical protein AX15_002769 [Amanita polypyramis BW_CC]|nr:hypothetical protein AX15_002769 [Amanita polypyramis BW_CC]
MSPDSLWFVLDEETRELIIGINQSKVKPQFDERTWKAAVKSLIPEFFYTKVVKGKQVPYTRVSHPNLTDDLGQPFKTNLGEVPKIVDPYINQQSASNSRKTPKFLHIISTPDDKEDNRSDGMDDFGFLRFDRMQDCICSTTGSVENTIGSAVL